MPSMAAVAMADRVSLESLFRALLCSRCNPIHTRREHKCFLLPKRTQIIFIFTKITEFKIHFIIAT